MKNDIGSLIYKSIGSMVYSIFEQILDRFGGWLKTFLQYRQHRLAIEQLIVENRTFTFTDADGCCLEAPAC